MVKVLRRIAVAVVILPIVVILTTVFTAMGFIDWILTGTMKRSKAFKESALRSCCTYVRGIRKFFSV